ncbi:uncharacterized protein LOC110235314 [Exaiptasia diaphana]|uniref:Uncharacterized protein n=1 Tax=Exaiptasia diaphana TaxID=2652724 RepID=A0A913WZ99_EXADI|nr:uncharacterized protein LOC110235314 [Exaiptasia diaphana]
MIVGGFYLEDFEREMDKTLEGGEFDEITDFITPYNLMKCKTNSLEKSLEVSHKLKSLADRGGPDSDDFENLANTVEDFAIELLEPLKRDDIRRAIFEGDSFDRIAEKIVVFRQKKFVSHPVVYNLLMRQWAGMFYHLRYSSLTSLNWFKWFLLNLWTVFDLVLFPLTFAILYVIHRIKRIMKHRQDHGVVLILNSTWNKEYLQKMRNLSSNILGECDQNHIKFASILRHKDGIITNTFMAKDKARSEVKKRTCKIATDNNTLQSCLENGKEMLKKFKARNSNKVHSNLLHLCKSIFFIIYIREIQSGDAV